MHTFFYILSEIMQLRFEPIVLNQPSWLWRKHASHFQVLRQNCVKIFILASIPVYTFSCVL